MFKLKIRTDNAAFQEDRVEELARILNEVISKIGEGFNYSLLFDINGNEVGEYTLTYRR